MAGSVRQLRTPVSLLVAAILLFLGGMSGWPWLFVLGLAVGIVGLTLLGLVGDEPEPAPVQAAAPEQEERESLAPVAVVSQEITELRRLLQGALDGVAARAEAKGLACKLVVADFVPTQVMVDSERLSVMLGALLERAIDTTESGAVELVVEPDGDFLRFAVRDSGSGIPRTQQDALFAADGPEPRLAEVRRQAELMGGKAGVRSVLGEGSRFWFTVSLNLPETKVPDAPPSDPFDA